MSHFELKQPQITNKGWGEQENLPRLMLAIRQHGISIMRAEGVTK